MAVEKMEAQIVGTVDKASLLASLWEVEKYARDTGKKLDQETVLDYRINSAKLKMELEKARGELRQAKKQWDQETIFNLTAKTTKLQSDLTQANRLLNNYVNTWNATLSRLQAKFDGITSTIKGQFISALSSIGTYFSIQKIKEFSDEFTSLSNRLKQVAEGESLDKLRGKIFAAANNARVDVGTYAAAFTRFDMVNNKLWWTQEETLIIMDSLAKWLSATWAEASEVNSVMLQLSQAFGSWRLAWDEFRSVSENMPILLDILAKNLWVARGELKQMAADGLITSKVLKDALMWANEQLNKSFEKSSVTIWQQMVKSTNDFIKKFGELDESHKMTQKVIEWIQKMSDLLIAWVDFVFKYAWAIWELVKILVVLKSAQALLGVANVLMTLPWLFGTATLWATLFASANTILAWTLARLGIASTAALWPLSALAAGIWAVIYAYWELKNAQDIKNTTQISSQNVRWQIANTTTSTAQEVLRLQRENKILSSQNTIEAKEKLKINENNLKIEQQKLKTQNLILQGQTYVSQGKFKENELLQKTINAETEKLKNLRDQYWLEQRVLDLKKENINLDLKNTNFIKNSWEKWWNGGKSEAIKQFEKEEKEKEKALKKEMKMEEDAMEENLRREEKLEKWKKQLEEKRIEEKKKLLEGINKWLDEEIKKSEKVIDGLKDQLKELEKIDDINQKIANRYVDIEKSIAKARLSLQDFWDIATRQKLENLSQDISQNVLSQLGGDEILDWWIKVSDLKEYVKTKKEIVDLEHERAIAVGHTTQAKIDEANLSETEKLIKDKKEIEDKLGLQNYQYDTEKANLEKRINDNQWLVEWYQKAQEEIEWKITWVLNIETQKRVKIIEREISALLKLIALRNQSNWTTATSTPTSTTNNVANTTNNNWNTNISVTDPTSAAKVIKMITTVLNGNSKGIK